MTSLLTSESVALAEQLLQLVKSIAVDDTGTREVDPLTVYNTKIQIQDVSDRLQAKTLGPLEYTVLTGQACQESEALYFVTILGIADLIGDGEAALADLSDKAGVDSYFLGVAMSCVVGRGYFEEVGGFGSKVYKNNELSAILRAHHPLTLKSAICFIGDEGFRATSRLLDAAKASQAAKASPIKTRKIPAVNLAFNFPGTVFEWMASPEQSWRGKRLGEAMMQLHTMANSNTCDDYPWHQLSSPIVDVGGGIGSLEMTLLALERNRHLEFIIFDIPGTIRNAEEVWRNRPTASQVSFVGGDFLAASQEETKIPVGKPTYIIRHVLHDWTDEDVISILIAVRRAMTAQSRLLLVEMHLRAESSRFVRSTSMQLLALNNGVTRTEEDMHGLLGKAGFKVEKVTYMRAVDSVIEAVIA